MNSTKQNKNKTVTFSVKGSAVAAKPQIMQQTNSVSKTPIAPSFAKSLKASGKEEVIFPISNSKPKKKVKDKIMKHIGGKGVSNWLMMYDPYLRTIADPEHCQGVQIPDAVTTPSSCFSIVDRRVLQVNSLGLASIAYGIGAGTYPGTPFGSMVPLQILGAGSFTFGCIGPSAITATSLYGFGVNTPTNFALDQWNGSSSTVQTIYSQVRKVSGVFKIVYTGNLLNAQGTITIVSAPRNWLRDESAWTNANLATNGVSLQMLQTHPTAQVISIPKSFGGECIVLPLDTLSTAYTDIKTVHLTSTGTIDSALGGEVYMVVSGAVPGQNFQCECIMNYEAIPDTNTFQLVNSKVSRDDPISMSNTMNHVAEMPSVRSYSGATHDMVGSVTSEDLGPTPQEGHPIKEFHPMQEKSMLESIVDGIGSGFKEIPKLIETAAPFLEALL